MAKAERTEVFEVSADKFYAAIINYRAYPEFVDGMKSIEVKDEGTDTPTVTYGLSLIKSITYTLKMNHKKNQEVSWSLVTGDMMKINNGNGLLKN